MIRDTKIVNGVKGADGIGYDGVTSTTYIDILMFPSPLSFMVNKQGAFIVGSRIRAVGQMNGGWIEGTITSINTTTTVQFIVNMDNYSEPNVFDYHWNITIAGTQGPAGPTGAAASLPKAIGRFYGPSWTQAQMVTTATIAVNNAYFMPFYLDEYTIPEIIGFRTGSGHTGTNVFKYEFFTDSYGVPSTSTGVTGTITTNAANTNFSRTNDVWNHIQGWVWLGIGCTSATGTASLVSSLGTGQGFSAPLGTTSIANLYTSGTSIFAYQGLLTSGEFYYQYDSSMLTATTVGIAAFIKR